MSKSATEKKRILVLGGGFAGIYAAMQLDKRLGKDADIELTLIDKQNFFLFTPMLHEVAASDLDITTIVSPIRQLLKRTTFLQGTVSEIDLSKKTVVVSHLHDLEKDTLAFDYLVLALGAQPNFFNLPGLQEGALTMQSLRDAAYLRNALIESLEEAEFDAYTGAQKPLLTYVVAGGGFAGVETVAAMNDFLRESLKFYPHVNEEMLRVVLVHDMPSILPELGDDLGQYAQKKLTERHVEVIVNTKVQGLSKAGVLLQNRQPIKAVLCVWTAGIKPNAVIGTLPCRLERGRLFANEFMEVPEYPFVWALGDCAYLLDPKTGKPYPPTAQHASRQGVVAAHNIEATIRGGTKRAFEYASIGQLAAIGRRAGVARIMGVKFSGLLAWLLWRAIYLMKLPRLEKKMRVLIEWSLDFFYPKDLVQFMTLPSPLVQNCALEHESESEHVHESATLVKTESNRLTSN